MSTSLELHPKGLLDVHLPQRYEKLPFHVLIV